MTIKQQGGVFGRNPTFNDLTAETVDINGGTIDGAVIGGSVPAAINGTTGNFTGNLDVTGKGFFRGSGSFEALELITSDANRVFVTGNSSTSGDMWRIGTSASNQNLNIDALRPTGNILLRTGGTNERMRVDTTGNLDMTAGGGNVILASGAGIDFSATAGTGTSELFDDYEEGTFTPTWTGLTTSGTETTNAGFYTKVGRIVHYSTFLQYSTSFVTTQGTTHHTLPFAPFKSSANFASNESNAANVYTGTGLIFSGTSLSYVPTVSAGNTMIVFSGTYMAV